MKVITKPTVEVIAKSQFIGSKTFETPDDGDDHTKIGSFAAKVCYDSNGKNGRSNTDNQREVMNHGHGSVLEHMTVSCYITGVSRGLTLELNRHRTFNISQRSTRYTAEEDAAIVLDPYYSDLYYKYNPVKYNADIEISPFKPNTKDEDDYILCRFLNNNIFFLQAYQIEVEHLMKRNPNNLAGFELRKWARGKARNLLPHGLESRGVWTNNHRGWRWFIESRSDQHAEPEIRRLADEVVQVLKKETPLYYEDFEVIKIHDNIPVWKSRYRKV